MKENKILMGMPVSVEIVADDVSDDIKKIFNYFQEVDKKFSTYKPNSEISRINRRLLKPEQYSQDMQKVLSLAEATKRETDGYFDVWRKGLCDPSGLVKGWAILNAANILSARGFKNFYVEAGGDIQAFGQNNIGKPWSVGIRNPFKQNEIVKVVYLNNCGLATSGNYERGDHIYNPKNPNEPITDIVSLTVIGTNVYEADRFATAAFAMGQAGINFIEQMEGLEGYVIDKDGIATETSGFEKYTKE